MSAFFQVACGTAAAAAAAVTSFPPPCTWKACHWRGERGGGGVLLGGISLAGRWRRYSVKGMSMAGIGEVETVLVNTNVFGGGGAGPC